MKILSAKPIPSGDGYWLAVLVDEKPRNEELSWREFSYPGTDASLMMAVCESGYVQAYQVVPTHPSGFGGSMFSFPMEDGTVREVKGPWQTNARAVMGSAAPLVMDVAVVTDPVMFSEVYLAPQAFLTFEKAVEVVSSLPGFELTSDEHGVPTLVATEDRKVA